MEYRSSIWSDEEALKFYRRVLVDLSPDESDFFCIAARKKYMSPEQRAATKMGDTCMMAKTILKSHDESKFINKIHQVDAGLDWYTARNGSRLERSCMVFYMNVNHTSVPKAVKDFKHELAEYDYEFSMASLKSNSESASRKLAGIHNRILKAFQDPKNQVANATDFDLDVDKHTISPYTIENAIKGIESIDGMPAIDNFNIIETQGGYHVLIARSALSNANKAMSEIYNNTEIKKHIVTNERVVSILTKVCHVYGDCVNEISVNQNGMVPLPGTLQNGFEVKMWEG